MEPDAGQSKQDEAHSARAFPANSLAAQPGPAPSNPNQSGLHQSGPGQRIAPPPGDPYWPWLGPCGLRAGWSLLLFVPLVYLLATVFGTILVGIVEEGLHWRVTAASAASTVLGESEWVAALATAMSLLSLAERRRILDYYLADRRVLVHFATGAAVGFSALSALVGAMAAGGWIRFGPHGLGGLYILKYAILWGLGFLLVACFEEGSFRGYVQFTLARGVNFWWAAALVAATCVYLLLTAQGNGAWGIYVIALLGAGPCLWLQIRGTPRNRFWQAAWAGSTGFGFIHTFNRGENWIGIFAAASIGFVFCVSVRLTGSVWWAIGCHAAWDWAESFFYGTADSGFAAQGHLLTTIPIGSALWSGGSDGPEGSVLVLPVIALLLVTLLVLYGPQARALHARASVRSVDAA